MNLVGTIVARVARQDACDNPSAVAEACERYRAESNKPSGYVLFVELDPATQFYNIEDVERVTDG